MLRAFTSSLFATAAFLSLASAANAQFKPSDFETPEFYANWGLNAINAQDAFALGFTGAGVKIAIADEPTQ